MIIEIATAAAMYLAENVTDRAAQSDIPQMKPRAAQCSYRDPVKVRQCFDRKQQEPDPYAALWDPNWISSVTPVREGEAASGSAKTPDPNVAKKPLK